MGDGGADRLESGSGVLRRDLRATARRSLHFPASVPTAIAGPGKHAAQTPDASGCPSFYRRENCPRSCKWNGTTWQTQTTPTGNDLHDIWGPVGNSRLAWLVANAGVIARWDGMSWTLQSNATGVNMYGVWGVDQSNVWAVGDFGTIARWNGTSWAVQMSGGTLPNNFGIWGTDANNVWVVGAGGSILKWNGTTWNKQSGRTTSELRGIWGTDANNIWAVGAGGTILRYGP